MKEIEEDYRRKKKQLEEEFALSNNTCKVGEVFTDHIGKIKILDINMMFVMTRYLVAFTKASS